MSLEATFFWGSEDYKFEILEEEKNVSGGRKK